MRTYQEIGQSIGQLVEKKQAAYGDSFGKSGEVISILYPGGIPPEKLDDALTVVRVVDKLFRIATDRDALGESPWGDIAGYAILSLRRQESRNSVKITPLDRETMLEAALAQIAMQNTGQESFCKLCNTVTEFKAGEEQPPHEHDPKCLLWKARNQ